MSLTSEFKRQKGIKGWLTHVACKAFGTANQRKLKDYEARIEQINAMERQMAVLTDRQLQAKTEEFKKQLAAGKSLDDILVPAFAVVREAAKRVLGMRHYDVQMIGGMALHEGKIAEMQTGEGKTLVATLPVYLNALTGKGAHVVTVNDYLAKRDSEWMGKLYGFLGLKTGCITHELDDEQRREQYACDITYGTNHEFGFDYLRDNIRLDASETVQREHAYAIVDEVDSILIDDARTPLILSGPAEPPTQLYNIADYIIKRLDETDYEIDHKERAVSLSEKGFERVENMLKHGGILRRNETLYTSAMLMNHVLQALRANTMFERGRDYLIRMEKRPVGDKMEEMPCVILIDQGTGRIADGRRYSDGLHQAIEAKEGVPIQPENVTIARISYQNLFKLYGKLSGMSGTAATDANEFHEIYKLDVLEVPTNKPVSRIDENDEVYKNEMAKFMAIVKEITATLPTGQPMLVGTESVEKSELLSQLLQAQNIPHQILNARNPEREAALVARAGIPGTVTISTNMAGRGTDIKLGGDPEMLLKDWEREETEKRKQPVPAEEIKAQEEKIKTLCAARKKEVLQAGGLYVIGTTRHESRRIDNQLRGRSGRQGDPGRSRFFLSLEDRVIKPFLPAFITKMITAAGIRDDEPLSMSMLSRQIEKAQQKMEAVHYEGRKNMVKFDNVFNEQRKAIISERGELMKLDDFSEMVTGMRHDLTKELIAQHIPTQGFKEEWDINGLHEAVKGIFGTDLPLAAWADEEGVGEKEFAERLSTAIEAHAAAREQKYGPEFMRRMEKQHVLQIIDEVWRNHMEDMDYLRKSIGLRGIAQRDPLHEYQAEALTMFQNMMKNIRKGITWATMHAEPEQPKETPEPGAPQRSRSGGGPAPTVA